MFENQEVRLDIGSGGREEEGEEGLYVLYVEITKTVISKKMKYRLTYPPPPPSS